MQTFNRYIKYRIYPNDEQKTMISKTFMCCRKIYNLMLEKRLSSLKETGRLCASYPQEFYPKYPFLKEVDTTAYGFEQVILWRLLNDYLTKKKEELPKFKSVKYQRQSYSTKSVIPGDIAILKNKIKIPKIGLIKAKIHRIAPKDWKMKHINVSQTPDGEYYVAILYEYQKEIKKVPMSEKVIGLDYKSDGLYMSSNGRQPKDFQRFFCKSQDKLAKARSKLSRKKIGSNRYKKQQRRVAKICRHISNQRMDALHKLAKKIAENQDIVCVENLNMKEISRKEMHLGKHTMDNGYGKFLLILEYKLNDLGKYLVKVDKWYASTQICSRCGKTHRLSLSQRTYTCSCGLSIDRDYNAAINIKREGLRILKERLKQ